MAPRRPLAAHVDPVQAPTRTWHVGAAPGRDGALFGAWKSKPEVHPRRVRSAPCRYPGIVAGLARRPARSTSSVGNSFWCGRFTRPKSPSGTGSVGDRWGHWDHSCGTATLGPPMPPSGQRRKRIQRSPTPSSPRSSPRRASSGLFSSLPRRWHHAPTPHGSILVTWTCTWTQVDIALKYHNSAQSWPFESKLGCPRA